MKAATQAGVRFEVDEAPPLRIAAGGGLQLAALMINSVVLVAAIIFRAGGGGEASLRWGVFAAVLCAGVSTILQGLRLGRVGAGYVIVHGTSSLFISVCVTALAEGGPGMLAMLVALSSLVQIALSARLSLLRRVLTPTVTGTVIMLLPVTVMPILADMLGRVPAGAEPAALFSALATVAVIIAVTLKGSGPLRLWGPALGVLAGVVTAALFGLYDVGLVAQAAWIGLPRGGWPGLDANFGPAFWGLLPVFVILMLVGSAKSIGVAVAVQRVSRRGSRAVDFRRVQGAVAAEGVGNLLAGLAGTVPNNGYPAAVSVVEMTGVAARSVGVAAGAAFVALAFLPKGLALILAIPAPVVAAFIAMAMALLFVAGMREVIQAGADYRSAMIVGVSFWAGTGLQSGVLFPEFVAGFAGGLLQNGMASGCLTAVLLTLLAELIKSRRRRFRGRLDIDELPRINVFLADFAGRNRWPAAMRERLEAASEETLLALLRADEVSADAGGREARTDRRLVLSAHRAANAAVLEFTAAAGEEENLQDRIALLSEQPEHREWPEHPERAVSLRLLRHLTSSVRHQQFHNADIVTIQVEPAAVVTG